LNNEFLLIEGQLWRRTAKFLLQEAYSKDFICKNLFQPDSTFETQRKSQNFTSGKFFWQ